MNTSHPEEEMEMFICEYFSPEEVRYVDIPYLLTPTLLQEDPRIYKFLLEKYSLFRSPYTVYESSYSDNPDLMWKRMNNTSDDDCWNSSPVHCLAYLAGEHSDYSKINSMDLVSGCYYGQEVDMDDDLACDILNWMMKYGADLNITNCFGKKAIDTIMSSETITGRVNNDKFKRLLRYYNSL